MPLPFLPLRLRPRAAQTRWLAAALLCTLVALAGRSPASADGIDDRLAAARKALLGRLESLASWCDSQRVFGVRDDVFRRILTLAPDHARARAALKYKRDGKDAPWSQSPDYRAPVDWNKGLVPQARQRLAEAFAGYRQEVMAALDGAGDVAAARRDEITERLIDLLPDDADLRRARGDVESGGRWVLPETVEAAARRGEIEAAVARAHAAFEDVRDRPSLATGWKVAWRLGDRLLLGTVTASEGLLHAKAAFATQAFCTEVLGGGDPPQWPPTIFVVTSRAQAQAILRDQQASAEDLRRVDDAASQWTPNHDLLVYGEDAELRRWGLVLQLIDTNLIDRVRIRRAWIAAGVAQRLAWHVLGRHGPGFAVWRGTDRPVDDPDDRPLPADAAPWLRAAAKATDRGGPTDFRLLFTRKLNAFRSGDVLMAYGLAAYLLEARPEAFVPFLEASGASEDPDAICQRVFSVDADVFYWRLRRWLLEQ